MFHQIDVLSGAIQINPASRSISCDLAAISPIRVPFFCFSSRCAPARAHGRTLPARSRGKPRRESFIRLTCYLGDPVIQINPAISFSISFDLIRSRVDLTKNPAKLGVYLGTTDLYTLPHWVPCACRHSPLLPAVHCSRPPREPSRDCCERHRSYLLLNNKACDAAVSSLCDEASVGFFAATGAAKATRLIRTGASKQLWCQRRRAGDCGAAVRDTHMDLRQLGWRESG